MCVYGIAHMQHDQDTALAGATGLQMCGVCAQPTE
jgi:hypothetical protein